MKTIKMHGILAKKFGKEFKLVVNSAREACRAIALQNAEFRLFMQNAEKHGYKFAVFNGKKQNKKTNIDESQLDDYTTSDTIHIVPKVVGAGGKSGGWLQIIAGVALVAVGFFTFGATSAYGAALIGAGVGAMVGGVASLLVPTPRIDQRDEDGNRANNGFGGAVTTVAQGNPVPILYGEREVGGFVASGGIYTEDKI